MSMPASYEYRMTNAVQNYESGHARATVGP